MNKGSYIIIEGAISSGKSTLARNLGKELNLKVFEEPVEGNPYLKLYYEDAKKYALQMQLYLLANRFEQQAEATKICWDSITDKSEYNGCVSDRSVFGDSVFETVNYENGNISDIGHQNYYAHRELILKHALVFIPHITIYLKTTPEVCYDRIYNLRKRDCELGISLEYLKQLDKHYDGMIEDLGRRGSKILTIDYNEFQPIEDIIRKLNNI